MYDVIKYINENLCDHLILNDISKHFGYSKWYFCDRFKQYTGLTFLEYVRHRRMQLAVQDILKGEKIIDIAFKYGYETPGGFNKSFLTEFGCMPLEFKYDEKKYRNQYEERKMRMYSLSDRCASLRKLAMDEKTINTFIRAQREYYFVQGASSLPEEKSNFNNMVAAGITSVIRNAPAVIQDGELIVGYNYADPEINEYDTDIMKKWLQDALFTNEEIQQFFLNRKKTNKIFAYREFSWISDDIVAGSKEEALNKEMATMGYAIADNHTVIDYEKILRLGFEGLIKELDQYSNHQDNDFYNAMRCICEAACHLGERYADMAMELFEKEKDPNINKDELLMIAKTCHRVPRYPAQNFMEAVQSLWFAHIINTWEDGINSNSLGRLDQILYPYYQDDIKKGVITKKEAFEIICCLWIKLYRDYDVQQSCVGGCDADGNSAVNELSYLMLDATEALDFIRCLSVRFSKDTDKSFMQRALEVVGHVQKGIPFFFNDDVMIPALVNHGIQLIDARNYTQIGCVETVIPGKSNPHAVTARCNLLKALEYALNDGYSMMNPKLRPGLETGRAIKFSTFSQLKDAVFIQMRHLLVKACEMTILSLKAAKDKSPKPYKSLLTDGCLASMRDFNDRGAIYDYYQVMLLGIPNLADSLAVMQKLVYQENRYTMDKVLFQIKNDYPDEAIRQDFINKVPKFGNDIDYVDDIAIEIMNFACDQLDEISEKYGYDFHAQPFTFLWMVEHGLHTAATPDGRHKGEILAYSVSPMQGRDFNGFTALTNSLAKLPTTKAPGTTSAIVEVDPYLFTNKNIPSFADILISAAAKGLCNIQFNVIDNDTLLDAQKYPNKHRNLAVRISGFSQKFYLLDKTLQDHIIERTKHKYI